ncbi:unnamed protein product [Parascedosporium putredinis]|uniref:Uncharacterized protein n=1 Tax=Parascedosporium putredinis TaxID=1442378 RepID=A0A9P1GYM4_9PEZI|nr:unnamed protein product [Parascedosporium putredinis]CAI7990862.1 unnamed protein product [Parascedosporium putredinis]
MLFTKMSTALALAAGATGSPLNRRADSETDFTIYAYGSGSEEIGGLPIISIDITATETGDSLVATRPNLGTSLFFVPSEPGAVGFTNATSDPLHVTTGFGFYGHVLFMSVDSTMNTQWYAVPTNTSTLWQVIWKAESDAAIPIALRNIAPS